MKNSKKWKDILYDFSDYIVAFIVGIVVISSFYRNINVFFVDIFGQNIAQSITDITKEDINVTDAKETVVNVDVSENTINKQATNDNKTDNVQKSNEQNEVIITIPDTAVSYDVVDILYENGLIQSKKDAISYLEKNKLDTKLSSGTFTLSKDMSIEEIANALIIH